MKTYKTLLIDPATCTITPLDLEDNLSAMYDAIGNDCNTVECVVLDNGNDMWVDEMGLFNTDLKAFKIGTHTIVGRAFVRGYVMAGDDEPQPCDTDFTVESLRKHVTFLHCPAPDPVTGSRVTEFPEPQIEVTDPDLKSAADALAHIYSLTGGISQEARKEAVDALLTEVGGVLIMAFNLLGLRTHMNGTIDNPPTNQRFKLTFELVGEIPAE